MRLIVRKERWGFSIFGWAVLLSVVSLLFFWGVKSIFPFFAVNKPIQGEVMVVEGWLPDYALKDAVERFRRNNYRFLITTGGPLSVGHYLSEYKASAALTAATIREIGGWMSGSWWQCRPPTLRKTGLMDLQWLWGIGLRRRAFQ